MIMSISVASPPQIEARPQQGHFAQGPQGGRQQDLSTRRLGGPCRLHRLFARRLQVRYIGGTLCSFTVFHFFVIFCRKLSGKWGADIEVWPISIRLCVVKDVRDESSRCRITTTVHSPKLSKCGRTPLT